MAASSGSRELAEIATRLRAAGNGQLRLKMVRGLRAGARPLVPAVREAARTQLPRRGGLNELVAGQRITVSVTTGARTAGVRLKVKEPAAGQTDSGYVRHPLPNNRRGKGQWVTQQIPAATGWWTKTLQERGREVTPALVSVMRETAAEIVGR